MKERLARLIGKDEAEKVPMGTFHSLAYRLLKVLDSEYSKLSIAPDWWRMNQLSDLCEAPSDKNYNGLTLGIELGELGSFISYQKSSMINPTVEVKIDLEKFPFLDGVDKNKLQLAYEKYEHLKTSSRQIDYDDMLLHFYNKLVHDDVFRNNIQRAYTHIMIDEFQDTSTIMLEIVKIINNNQKKVFVVGDFRQSIYGFNQSDINNILDFKEDFNDVRVIDLNTNFRSTQTIVELSNKIIDISPIEKYKQFTPSKSDNEVGEPVEFTLYSDEYYQAEKIVESIIEYKEKKLCPLL